MIAQRKALEKYGIEAQLLKLAEECAELGAAALHVHADGGKAMSPRIEALLEEVADVEIMLEAMRLAYGDQRIDTWRAKKLHRLAAKLGMPPLLPGDLARPSREQVAVQAPSVLEEEPAPRQSGHNGGRPSRPVYVDGERFSSLSEAMEKYGAGLYAAVRRGVPYKGYTVSFEAPIPVEKAPELHIQIKATPRAPA